MDEQTGWSEQDSATYRALAEIAVPTRREFLASLLCVLPFGKDESFRIVELGCGEGVLARAALTAFPKASVLALDGSESMQTHAAALLAPFERRAAVEPFTLEARDWFNRMDAADCVISSLVVHHLTADGKRRLFREAHNRLSERGALLLADLVLPQRSESWRLYADAYDAVSKRQSIERAGDTALFDRLVAERWNYYRHPDDAETPSPLSHQLEWLSDAGFDAIDCFWLQAGHAVYGGYKTGGGIGALSLPDALAAVDAALAANAGVSG